MVLWYKRLTYFEVMLPTCSDIFFQFLPNIFTPSNNFHFNSSFKRQSICVNFVALSSFFCVINGSIFYLLKQGRFNEINDLYHSHLWRKGVEQEVELNGEKLKVVIDSVNESGQLNILKNNQLEAVNLQEIVFFY